GIRADVTSSLRMASPYILTLALGGNGVLLDAKSVSIDLEWENKLVSSLPVIQPVTPLCDKEVVTYPESLKPFTIAPPPPPHVAGDANFNGNGPSIYANAYLTFLLTMCPLRFLWMR